MLREKPKPFRPSLNPRLRARCYPGPGIRKSGWAHRHDGLIAAGGIGSFLYEEYAQKDGSMGEILEKDTLWLPKEELSQD
jgi:hypothetical protein